MTDDLDIGLWFRAAVLTGTIVVPPAAHAIRTRRVDLLSAPWIFAVMMIGGYVVPLRMVAAETDLFFSLFPGSLERLTASTGHALLVAAVGALGFHAGYFVLGRFGARVYKYGPPLQWNPGLLRAVSVVYVVLGAGLFVAAVVLIGGPSALLSNLGDRIRLTAGINYLFQAVNLLLVVVLLWWVRALLSKPWQASWLFWSYATVALGAAALQGSKSILFIFVLWSAILCHRLRRRISNSVVVLGGITAFVVLGAYALFLREYLAIGQFVTISEVSPAAVWLLVKRELGGNFFQLQALTVLVDRMPDDLTFQHGRTFLATLALPVPRGLWPGKPLPSTGVFTTAFWPDSWMESGTSLPPGLIGELYMNFSVAGVLVGMAGFGAIIRAAERRGFGPSPSVVAMCFSTLLVATIPHYIRGDFAVSAIVLILFLPTAVGVRLVTLVPRTWPRTGAQAAPAPRPEPAA